MIVLLGKLPILLLSLGVSFLLSKRSYNFILISIIFFLILEVVSYITATKNIWTLYFSAPVYFWLVYTLYNTLFFTLIKKRVLIYLLLFVIVISTIGVIFINQIHPNFVFNYIAIIECFILLFPIVFFKKILNQEIPYRFNYFLLNAIIFSFFTLDIIIYVFLKFIIEKNLLQEIHIRGFRYIILQLFYISLIYFGWRLDKK